MSYSFRADLAPSGQAWIGDVPRDWKLQRLGKYFEARNEKVSDSDFPALSVTKNGIVPQLETAAKTDAGDNRKRVCVGDFVINSRSDRKGSSGVSALDGSVSLISIVLEPRGIHRQFAHNLLRSYPFQEEFYRFGKGIVADLWSTNYSDMKNIIIPVPPDDEQAAIANFLDCETAKIDNLIAKQEQLIKLLEEKHQATISHAVTKGLKPDVRMEDSGVWWLGRIPESWTVTYLTHLVCDDRKIMYGIVLPGPNVADGVPIVKGGDVKPGRLRLDRLCKTTFEIESSYVRSRLREGDLVYSIRGTIGDVEIVPAEIEGANLTQDAARIAPKPHVCNRWLKYTMQSRPVYSQLEVGSLGAAVRGVNIRDLKKAVVPVPSDDEMVEIANFLDIATDEYNRLSGLGRKQIDLLKERRTALISAAVTGKIDVRNVAQPKDSHS